MEADKNAIIAATTASLLLFLLMKKKKKQNRSKKRIWMRSWVSRRPSKGVHSNLLEELRIEDKTCYRTYLRMDESTYNYILTKITPLIIKQATHLRNPISPNDRLLATLRYLATGETYSSLQFTTRIPQCTLSAIIPDTFKAIYQALKETHLKIPDTEQEWKNIAKTFEENWNVLNCIGALDGKHVRINCPPNSGSHFFNYKLFNSIVLLALVDANYKFLYVDAGTNGRIGDSGVYTKSKLRQCLNDTSILNIPLENNLPNTDIKLPYVVLADDAFPLSYHIMKPYTLRNITRHEKNFNYRLSRGRRVVESAFGILASRFRVLFASINLSPLKVQDIVLACCTLHNVLIDIQQTRCLNRNQLQNSNTDEDVLQVEDNMLSLASQQRESFLHGTQVRNYFKDYYNGLGSVPWQDNKI